MTPFAGGQGTRWFLARLSSISSRQEMDPGVQGRVATLQIGLVGTSLQKNNCGVEEPLLH